MYEKSYKILAIVLVISFCVSCATKPSPTTDAWADATIVAEQSAVIDAQRRTLDDLGEAVGAIQRDLEGARTDLDRAIGEARDLRGQWEAIDRFVRAVIDAERQLEELQRADRGADAGEG